MSYAKFLVRLVQATLACCFWVSPARADWYQPSLEFKCDKAAGTFTLAGVVEANEQFYIPHRPGFQSLPSMNQLTCKLDGVPVTLNIQHTPPHERGMCAAVSFYAIEKLAVGKAILFRNVPFNHICGGDPSLYEVTITKRGRTLHVKSCMGKWEWENSYSNSECTEKVLD